jgi:RNA polymerase sigma factor (sigma-70 family)
LTSFESYCQSIRKHPLLTQEDENRLSGIIQTSKNQKEIDKAIQELIEGNLRLVVKISLSHFNRFSHIKRYVDIMDLISEGNIAMMRATARFNSKKGKFSTFAGQIIENHLHKIIDLCRFIHIPSGHFKYWKKIDELKKKYGQYISEELVSEELGISPALVQNIIASKKNNHLVMLDEIEEWQNLFSDNNAHYENIKGENLKEYLLKKVKAVLNEKEQKILETFMIYADTTLEEMAFKFKLSKEKIRQIYLVSLRKLKRIIIKEWEEETHIKPREIEFLKDKCLYYRIPNYNNQLQQEERTDKILEYFLSNK